MSGENRAYWEAYREFDQRSDDMLVGNAHDGYSACIELCDRWTGQGRTALHWLSRHGVAEELTFDELHLRSSQFASLLQDMGICRGDRVAGLLPRTPDLLTVLLGTLRAGAVYQPLFTAFGPKGIEARLAGSNARLVVTDAANRPKLADITVEAILVVDQPDGPESLPCALAGRPESVAPIMLSRDDPFLMMFTSGTTGTPKAVVAPIHMLRAVWAYVRYGIGLRDTDTYWNLADPGWAYGLYYGLCGPLLMGQAATLSEASFSVDMAYDVIDRFGVTNLAGAPTAFRALASSGPPPVKSVRVISSAGEPLDSETRNWLASQFGCHVGDHYGQTEVGMVICDHNGLAHRRGGGAIGFALPGFQVTTVRGDGKECSPGEPGMLAVHRASSLFWFAGYDQRDEQPFLGDYYLTGDSAVRREDGSFHFIGRDDDVITSSGYRIGPFEVESALMEHPAVAEAAAVGKPDAVRTELVKAFVKLAPGHQPTMNLADEISLFVKKRLAAHAYPREIEFVRDLPKTQSGKIQRYLLKQQESGLTSPSANAP